MIEEFNVD